MITGFTQVFGLVGHPVRHSLSPQMHSRLFETYGIDGVYVAFDVDPARADRVADAIRTLDLRGCNLTVPFKQAVMPHLDTVTRAGQEAGAVNVVIHHEGHLTGYNTDGEGFVRGVESAFGDAVVPGATAMVLGAGGAGRAVAAGLADRGASRIVLLNRTVRRAQEAAETLSEWFPKVDFQAAPLDDNRLGEADLVVNCTAGPAADTIRGFDVGALGDAAVWCDINYWMDDPPLLQACRDRGLRVQGGLPMLVQQGALSFELFTGQPVDAAAIHRWLAESRPVPR